MVKGAKKNLAATGGEGELQPAAPLHLWSLFNDMERAMESWLPSGLAHPFRWHAPLRRDVALPFGERAPCVDLIDRDKEIVLRAELPGVEKKDLEVSVTDGSVTIRGKVNHESKEEKEDYYRCERVQGSFSRTVPLPASIDGTKVKASLVDGLLELHLPKLETTRRHTVKVE